ncbi:MAG: hypothetical protein ABJC13_20460 [Acidobacteriota bacterium]
MKSVLALSCGLLAMAANAATDAATQNAQASNRRVVYTRPQGWKADEKVVKAVNISYHGGPTITTAKVVYIFWGSAFCVGGVSRSYATTLQAYRNQLGTTPEYNVITQYSGITLANLGTGTPDLFDCTNPATNVTDSAVRTKVNAYISAFGFNASTIYEVVIPSTSYSSNGASTSCGGPGLAYCAYHSWIGSGASAKKYSIEPYPSCSGCQVAGWSDVQDAEHFMCHETREAVTDPTGLGWYDSSGEEADDKCAWSPSPFLGTGGYGYQYEWSNTFNACKKTLP